MESIETELSEGARETVRQMVFVATAVVLLVSGLHLAFSYRGKQGMRKRLPPGPRGLPLLGSLLSISKLPHVTFREFAATHGHIVFLRLGVIPTLVVSSPRGAKQIYRTLDHIWASRPGMIIPTYLTYGRKGLAFSPLGPDWGRLRKFYALELFNPSRLERTQVVREQEVRRLLPTMLEAWQQGKPIVVEKFFFELTTNFITQMLWTKSHFGPSAESRDSAQQYHACMVELFYLTGVFNIADYIPLCNPVMMKLQGFEKRMKAGHELLDNFVENILEEHRQAKLTAQSKGDEVDGNTNADFVDLLMENYEPGRLDDSPGEFDGHTQFSREIVKAVLTEMISAGTDTTAVTVQWAFAELIRNPKLMRKVQDELSSVVGHDRLVNGLDVSKLKYLPAVFKETLRMHPAAPLGVPHMSVQDCEIDGFHIPAGTQVFVNVWAIQRDPALWERPLEFDPDRFLTSGKDVKGQDFDLLPFGSGRRICPGMEVAVRQTQYILAFMLHAFNWSLSVDGHDDQSTLDALDMSEGFGISCPMANPLRLFATPRLPVHVICPNFPNAN